MNPNIEAAFNEEVYANSSLALEDLMSDVRKIDSIHAFSQNIHSDFHE